MINKAVDGVTGKKLPPNPVTHFDITDKNKRGRPFKLTPEQREEVLDEFVNYVESESYPTMPDFVSTNKVVLKYKVSRENMLSWDEFREPIKLALEKQERFTEGGVMRGKIPPAWAIFKLKQPAFGWTDKQQVEHSGDMTINQTFNPAIKDEFEQFLKAKDVIDVTPKQLPDNE